MRKQYLDNIRWITVVIVVIYHVIYMYNGVQPFGVIGAFSERQYQDAFQYLTYPWFMALLFVVSGMSSRFYLDNHTDKEFRKARTTKLLIPSTLGIVVFHWTVGYYNTAISGVFDRDLAQVPGFIKFIICILSGTGVLWYIQMLWIFSMLLLLVRRIEKDRIWNLGNKVNFAILLAFSFVIYGSAQILNTPVITVYRFGIYGVSFFMGYFVFSHDEVVERITRYRIILGIMAIVLGISYTVVYFGENYAIEPVINNLMACLYCWIAILAVLALGNKYLNFENKYTKWMKKRSWGLYVFHYLPLAMTAYYLNKYASSAHAMLCYILVGVAAFAGGYLINEIIIRVPGLRYFVLGIKREKQKDV